ncbi:hypothetical protein F4680DRAFT_461336 [Xylaria scruposa]|nr:hypothetical protein F4680DRAFT_461336 [Xylaria scruposa]
MEAQGDQVGLPCSNAIEGSAARGFDAADGVKDFEVLKSCPTCDSETKLRCPNCRTWYCKKECLVKDWKNHQVLCKSFNDKFIGDKAPVNHVRAILFPWDADKPTWIWIHLKTLDVSITRALGITGKGSLKKAVNKLAVVDLNKSLHHRKIGHGIRQFTAPNARFESRDGHNVNKSIFALSDPGSLKTYFGSAIFFGFRTYQAGSITRIYYEDTSSRDLRMIIEWYLTRPENPYIPIKNHLPLQSYCNSGERLFLWPAVKLNCVVDKARLEKLSGRTYIPPFENVWVLSKDLSQNRTPCELAQMAGLPWLTQPCCSTFDPITDKGEEKSYLENQGGQVFGPEAGRRLRRMRLDNQEGWVLPADLPTKYCGSLLVTRSDGGFVGGLHLLAFYDFVRARFKDVPFHAVYPTGEETVGRAILIQDVVRRIITREGFEEFWSKDTAGEVYVSPYNKDAVARYDTAGEVKEEVKEELIDCILSNENVLS